MKKTILFTRWLAVLVVVAAMPLSSFAAFNQILYTANYNSTPVLGTDTLGGVTYSTVSYGDLYNGGAPGMPYLPIDYIRFSVPYNATNFSVTATWSLSNSSNYNLGHLVYPSQPPRLMNDTTPIVVSLPDSSAYFSGNSYPSQMAWVVDEGFLEGENHIVTVAVTPFSYVHTTSTDKVSLRKKINLKLHYDLSDSLAMYPIVRNDSALREEGYSLARSMVVNPGQVKTFAPVDISYDFDSLSINPNGMNGDGLNGGIFPGFDPPDPTPVDTTGWGEQEMQDSTTRYTYLIVTTSDLLHSVRRIAALKRQKGYNVKVVTMDQVVNDPHASFGDRIKQDDGTYTIAFNDDAGKLRQYLRYHFSRFGTKYVLLVGNDIPHRNIPNPDNSANYDLLSDLYYSDISANWDYTSWNLDYFPELYVGRLLSRNSNQIDNYTDKLLRYEMNPGAGESSYLKRAFFSEGREFRGKLTEVESELMTFYPNQIEINDTITNNTYFPEGKDIIDTLNVSRVGFASILNHGDATGIQVYGKDRYNRYSIIKANSSLNSGDGLNCLTNKNKPMIYYALSCASIPFDNSTVNLGESFTIGKDYGGPVFVGYTRNITIYGTIPIFKRFVNNLKNGMYNIGMADAFSKALSTRFGTYCEIMTHAYLGDPSLELWTDEPQQFSNIVTTRTNNSITVSGINVDSTVVVYYPISGSTPQTALVSSGVTFSNVSPNGMVILYKHNYLPYIAPLYLQNETLNKSKFVIASDVTAGNLVDNNRSEGNVIIKCGIEYEIETSGTVTLDDGFKVEKGAIFAVYPSSF